MLILLTKPAIKAVLITWAVCIPASFLVGYIAAPRGAVGMILLGTFCAAISATMSGTLFVVFQRRDDLRQSQASQDGERYWETITEKTWD